MKTIGIIGAGFSGLMTAIHLLRKSESVHVVQFDPNSEGKGIAYNPQSDHVLLNVVTAKMSAFPDKPDHFLHWCKQQKQYSGINDQLLRQSFLPRSLYGKYLHELYTTYLIPNERFKHFKETVIDIEIINERLQLKSTKQQITLDMVVLATGNALPSNLVVPSGLIKHPRYHQNPWKINFSDISNNQPIVIVGNGLSMVDTVMELRARKFDQQIYAVSPNGFNILPHRQFNFTYDGPLNNLSQNLSLKELINLFKLELRKLQAFGISAEPLVDALRPHTQNIWQKMSHEERRFFMNKIRHLWGQARHRLPFVSYDFIQKEQISEKLIVLAGKLDAFTNNRSELHVTLANKKNKNKLTIPCAAVINCTGPESNYNNIEGNLLGKLVEKGVISQDALFLGIETDENFQIINKSLQKIPVFALGPLLKGKLWESTAVNELRIQAKNLAEIISRKQAVGQFD
jgi:uncharacterized NAD(P)/FAD-binding protein YdhS